DLERETGLALADFDVLAQLAEANGELRMTELADRALISRSGMSRRVARLVDEGLLRRERAGTDARGVVVTLTDAGIARLRATSRAWSRGRRPRRRAWGGCRKGAARSPATPRSSSGWRGPSAMRT